MSGHRETTVPDATSRRRFIASSVGLFGLPAILANAAAAPINDPAIPAPETVGPVLGHIDESRIFCFVRPATPGMVTLVVKDSSGREVSRQSADADIKNDLCVHFQIKNLEPGTLYIGEFYRADG